MMAAFFIYKFAHEGVLDVTFATAGSSCIHFEIKEIISFVTAFRYAFFATGFQRLFWAMGVETLHHGIVVGPPPIPLPCPQSIRPPALSNLLKSVTTFYSSNNLFPGHPKHVLNCASQPHPKNRRVYESCQNTVDGILI